MRLKTGEACDPGGRSFVAGSCVSAGAAARSYQVGLWQRRQRSLDHRRGGGSLGAIAPSISGKTVTDSQYLTTPRRLVSAERR